MGHVLIWVPVTTAYVIKDTPIYTVVHRLILVCCFHVIKVCAPNKQMAHIKYGSVLNYNYLSKCLIPFPTYNYVLAKFIPKE